MKILFFDTGPVISLTTNNLLWLLKELQEAFNGEFCITSRVKDELVERPLRTKKFKFEALQVKRLLEKGVLKVYHHEKLEAMMAELLDSANHVFSIKGNYLNIIHEGEVEVLASVILADASALVIDERTTRLLVEDPARLEYIFKRKFHTKIKVHQEALKRFQELVRGVKIIRSVELVTVAYERGLLDEYITDFPDARKTLLQSVLWGVKLHGCSISHLEIDKIVKLETRKKR